MEATQKPDFINDSVHQYLQRLEKRNEGLEITLDALIKLSTIPVTDTNKSDLDNLRNIVQHFLVRGHIDYKVFN